MADVSVRKCKTKKIYRYENRLVSPCMWCDGTGFTMGLWLPELCLSCEGQRGKWKRVKILVGEEVIE
jgi:Na+/H+ antiporter NhaA